MFYLSAGGLEVYSHSRSKKAVRDPAWKRQLDVITPRIHHDDEMTTSEASRRVTETSFASNIETTEYEKTHPVETDMDGGVDPAEVLYDLMDGTAPPPSAKGLTVVLADNNSIVDKLLSRTPDLPHDSDDLLLGAEAAGAQQSGTYHHRQPKVSNRR